MTYNGQNSGGENAPEANFGESLFDLPQSVDPNLEYKASKEKACDKYKGNRQDLNGEISDQLEMDVLTSHDDQKTILDVNISVESKYEKLYARFISDVIALTLNRNKNFSNSLMFKAAKALVQNAEFRSLYKEANDLIQADKEKKDPDLEQKLDDIADKIKVIANSYSLDFDRSVFDKSLNYQARMLTFAKVLPKMNLEQKAALDKAGSIDEKIAIVNEVVAASGDLELQKEWEEEQAKMKKIEKAEEEAQKPKEDQKKPEVVQTKPAVAKNTDAKTVKAYENANAAVFNTGYTVSSDGSMSLSPQMTVHVEVNEKGQYSIVDQYSGRGKIGPFELKDLPEKAYERYLDGYVSKKIMPMLKQPNEISGVKDEYLIGLCKALVGDGAKNKYRIEGDNKIVLDNLVNSLAVTEKGLALNEKVFQLYKHTVKDEQTADGARRRLLAVAKGDRLTVKELLGKKADA